MQPPTRSPYSSVSTDDRELMDGAYKGGLSLCQESQVAIIPGIKRSRWLRSEVGEGSGRRWCIAWCEE